MMRCVLSVALVLACLPVWAEDSKPAGLKDARRLWLRGNYAEAREKYQELLQDTRTHDAAVIGQVRCFLSESAPDKALSLLETEIKKNSASADLHAWLAEIHYQNGQWQVAEQEVAKALAKRDEHFQARWVRARLYRDRGDMLKADAEMRWFVRTYTRRSDMDDDIKDPDELLIVGQAGTENARWHNLSDQFRFILNEVYGDVLKFEPDCWMAEFQAGMMLSEKFNKPEAIKAFNKALKINPRAAEVFVGKGSLALQSFEIRDAEQWAEEALRLNPLLTSALRLRADVCLMTSEYARALALLEKAMKKNSCEEATLARLTACAIFMHNPAQAEKTIATALALNPKPGTFYTHLAQALDDRKYYRDAEKYFTKAIEVNEKLAGPKSNLGLLYMRLGKEKEARQILDKAFKADPFNVRVANSRKVLTHLEAYATKESTHYILRFDAKTDAIMAEFLLDFLEEVHARLLQEYGFEPEGKILIELFNNHEMFSGRTVALPDLHTIGACTGKVVTIVSPHGKGIPKLFNWGRVIRHELVHIFNLAQTDFQTPHWLTEGLAVRNEGTGRPPNWDVILRERYQKNTLLTLDTIQLGFVRPRSLDEWALAYCQSLFYVEYMIEKFGLATIGKMLDAYRSGSTDAEAIQKACGIDKAAFEKGYQAYVSAIVQKMPVVQKHDKKSLTLKELEAASAQDPDNHDLASELARVYQQRNRTAEAGKIVKKILAHDKTHVLAGIVQARLLIAGGEDVAARTLIESIALAHPEDVRVRAFLARLKLEAKEFAQAAKDFEICRRQAPYEGQWLDFLAEIYEKLDDKTNLLNVLKNVAQQDADDLKTRIKIAQLLLAENRTSEAESYAREAMLIDVLNLDARKALLTALKAQHKDALAEKIEKRFAE